MVNDTVDNLQPNRHFLLHKINGEFWNNSYTLWSFYDNYLQQHKNNEYHDTMDTKTLFPLVFQANNLANGYIRTGVTTLISVKVQGQETSVTLGLDCDFSNII